MHDSTHTLTDDLDDIKNALIKLYACQGIFLDSGVRDDLADGLVQAKLPRPAIIAGILALREVHLRRVSLGMLIDAAREKVIPEAELPGAKGCTYCNGVGHVQMYRPGGTYRRTLACTCAKGGKLRTGMKMPPWNGEYSQDVSGETCVLCEWNRPDVARQ